MPRQRTHHSRRTYVFPDDFPQRLVRFKEESDLPWAEIARRLGTYPHTVKRWWKEGVRPHFRHQMALLDLADDLGLGPSVHRLEHPARNGEWDARLRRGRAQLREGPQTGGPAAMQEPKAKGGASAGRPRPQGLKTQEKAAYIGVPGEGHRIAVSFPRVSRRRPSPAA